MSLINYRERRHCHHDRERGNGSPIPYSVLYDSVISQIKDYAFAELTDTEIYDILSDYVRPAIVRFQSCKKDLSDRDDEREMFYCGLNELEIEILARFMVVEFLDTNYVRVPSLLKMMLTPKDFQTFSPAKHLEELQALRTLYMEENRQLMRDYSYRDSELFAHNRRPRHGKAHR